MYEAEKFDVDLESRRVTHRRTGAWVQFSDGDSGIMIHTTPAQPPDLVERAEQVARAAGMDLDRRFGGRFPFRHPRLNGLGRRKNGTWLPIEIRNENESAKFFDPSGFAIPMPEEFRTATAEEIDRECRARGMLIAWRTQIEEEAETNNRVAAKGGA